MDKTAERGRDGGSTSCKPRPVIRFSTDEIVPVQELRDYLVTLVEMCYQSFGYRRVKNPRIWSMHDLNVLTDFAG